MKILPARGYALRVLVRRPDDFEAPEGVEVFEGDLLRPESLEGIETDIDLVVHGAGILGKWGTDDSVTFDVNVKGTVHLLERFRNHPGLTRFIYLSAGGVTGPAPTTSVDETYVCQPSTSYEKAKYAAERKVLELSPELKLPGLVVRPTFTYGPGDPHKLPLFRAVKKGKYAFIGGGHSVNRRGGIAGVGAGRREAREGGAA
ncbi:MAG: NAD-dependent epimerase/dehydratase family protein, partial [Verrucomicrobiota bacterium]